MSIRAAATLGALAFAAVTMARHWSFGAPIDFLVLESALGGLFIVAGAVAWWRRPDVRTGPLLTLCGVIWFAGGYTAMPEPLGVAIAFGLLGLYDLPLAYLVLTFPAERLVGARAVAVAALGLGLIGRSASRLLFAPHPFTPFGNESVFQIVESQTSWLIAAAALVVAMLGVVRWRTARPFLRRLAWPLFAAGVIAMAFATVDAVEFALGTLLFEIEDIFGLPFDWAFYGARALIPLGFLIGTLRLRQQRLGVAEVALQSGGTSAAELERALSATLRDPELAVLRWSDAANVYLDREGRPVELPESGDPTRAVTYVDEDGKPYAAVVHDALLVEERSILGFLRDAARHAVRGDDLRAAVGSTNAELAQLPSGDVTLLFSDIEDSTGHLQRLGFGYADLLERFRSRLREAVRDHGGRQVDAIGDEFVAAFLSPSAAARAAVAIQRRLQRESSADEKPLRARIGLHRGEATLTPGGYVGLDVHRAARIMSAANGGQILVSEAVAASAESDVPEITVRRLGPHALRGLAEPVDVAMLGASDLESPPTPIRAVPAAIIRA